MLSMRFMKPALPWLCVAVSLAAVMPADARERAESSCGGEMQATSDTAIAAVCPESPDRLPRTPHWRDLTLALLVMFLGELSLIGFYARHAGAHR
jgi:hypothetical protein